jgi:hypothetical protein
LIVSVVPATGTSNDDDVGEEEVMDPTADPTAELAFCAEASEKRVAASKSFILRIEGSSLPNSDPALVFPYMLSENLAKVSSDIDPESAE